VALTRLVREPTQRRCLISHGEPNCDFARKNDLRYPPGVAREATTAPPKLWKPHPDDEGDVQDAFASVDRGELLSAEASDAFLRWLEGSEDESWRGESG